MNCKPKQINKFNNNKDATVILDVYLYLKSLKIVSLLVG